MLCDLRLRETIHPPFLLLRLARRLETHSILPYGLRRLPKKINGYIVSLNRITFH